MLVQASWTEEGRVVFGLYRTGAEAANGMHGIYTLKNVKSTFLASIFIPFRRREFTKSFMVSSRMQDAHVQTVYTRPRFPPPTQPGYEARFLKKSMSGLPLSLTCRIKPHTMWYMYMHTVHTACTCTHVHYSYMYLTLIGMHELHG